VGSDVGDTVRMVGLPAEGDDGPIYWCVDGTAHRGGHGMGRCDLWFDDCLRDREGMAGLRQTCEGCISGRKRHESKAIGQALEWYLGGLFRRIRLVVPDDAHSSLVEIMGTDLQSLIR
jgi:hypothetical protein